MTAPSTPRAVTRDHLEPPPARPTPPAWTFARDALGRADFVRLVYRRGKQPTAHDPTVDQLLAAGLPPAIAGELVGLEERPCLPQPPVSPMEFRLLPPEPKPERLPQSAEPSLPPPLWRAVGPLVTVLDESAPPRPEWLRDGPELERLESAGQPPPPRPLIPPARLGCVLRQRLLRQKPGTELDVRRLVDALARGRHLSNLPRCPRKVWPRRVALVWDGSRPLRFCWWEQRRVADFLEQWLGELAVEHLFTEGSSVPARVVHGERLTPHPFDPYTTLLAMSDLGAIDGDPSRRRMWERLARSATRAGAPALALVLAPRARWAAGLARGYSVTEWEYARPARSATPRATPREALEPRAWEPDPLAERLVTLLAPTIRIEPGLLRAARDLLAPEGATFATELDAWLDPRLEIRSREGGALSKEARDALRPAYLELPKALRRAFEARLQEHHGVLSPPLLAEELLACAREPSAEGADEPPLAAARGILAAYARRLEAGRGTAHECEALYVERLTARQQVELWADDRLAAVWAFSHLTPKRDAFTAAPPPGLDLRRITYALRPEGGIRWLRVLQQGSELAFEAIADRDAPHGGAGVRLGELPYRADQVLLRHNGEPAPQLPRRDHDRVLLHPSRPPRYPLPRAGRERPLRLESDLAELTLRPEAPPPWAERLSRDRHGLWVRAVVAEFEWTESTEEASSPGLWQRLRGARPTEPPRRLRITRHERPRDVLWPPWADSLYRDEHGLVATLRITRTLTHRLRFIPPGRFLMGSPENEPERRSDERQHWVTLSRGFWLGQTAVPQALWEAVMGENPSRFRGEKLTENERGQLPVEQVSWDDCQRFCERLGAAHPGLGARLPTEAEWEYACRAGTDTPFNLGANITPDQVNYEGNYPYAGGAKGKNRQRTLPVGDEALPPNAWGLRQMHGNVWEWCEDWDGEYAAAEQRDPMGPAEGRNRVYRGGCWRDHAGSCRSAYRSRDVPAIRNVDLGFRLAAVQPAPEPAGTERSRDEPARAAGTAARQGASRRRSSKEQ